MNWPFAVGLVALAAALYLFVRGFQEFTRGMLLEVGRLRRRIEVLEASLLGTERAEEYYNSIMTLRERLWDNIDDPDWKAEVLHGEKLRDGKMPPDFTESYFGKDGLESRICDIEKKLGITRPEED